MPAPVHATGNSHEHSCAQNDPFGHKWLLLDNQTCVLLGASQPLYPCHYVNNHKSPGQIRCYISKRGRTVSNHIVLTKEKALLSMWRKQFFFFLAWGSAILSTAPTICCRSWALVVEVSDRRIRGRTQGWWWGLLSIYYPLRFHLI